MEPAWPQADVIIGNPPFLGWFKLRAELSDQYVNDLRNLYEHRVPGGADLLTYWFERSRDLIERGKSKRAGLLATQGIRGGANRSVLERIKQTGEIFMAWSDRPWILNGAAVRVSILGFDSGIEKERVLDGKPAELISSDLRDGIDLTKAQRLLENRGICYLGTFKFGAFEITSEIAMEFFSQPLNPNGRPNNDVIHPWINGLDITRRPRKMWVKDFGDLSEDVAAMYEGPFEYVRRYVKPDRDNYRREHRKQFWWKHGETSPGLFTSSKNVNRYIGSPRVSKYRLFVWLDRSIIPDSALIAFARSDDYFFGVLHSRPHEIWALILGTALTDRPRYTPNTTFETFPFPWFPEQEPWDDPRLQAVASASQELVQLRDAWLNPPGLSGAELKKRTLTNLYNQRPTRLDMAHRKLDQAVFSAYGWPFELSDEEILEHLLSLNHARASIS